MIFKLCSVQKSVRNNKNWID